MCNSAAKSSSGVGSFACVLWLNFSYISVVGVASSAAALWSLLVPPSFHGGSEFARLPRGGLDCRRLIKKNFEKRQFEGVALYTGRWSASGGRVSTPE